jgi:hypothetical protein
MMTHRIPRLAAALVSATLLATLAVSAASAHDPGPGPEHGRGLGRALDAVRDATERFKDVNQAIAAGYAQPPAPAPLHECISSFDGTGAMGFHFINGSLLDTKLDPRKPEVLVYAPDRGGRLHLVALEYVVFQAPWMAIHGSKMPSLFHQMFMATGEPNRFEIPAFFSLHVWLYKHNPSGLFAPFNPTVSCDPGHHGPRHDAAPNRVQTASLRFACDIDRATSGSSTRRT